MVQRGEKRRRLKGRRQPGLAAPLDIMKPQSTARARTKTRPSPFPAPAREEERVAPGIGQGYLPQISHKGNYRPRKDENQSVPFSPPFSPPMAAFTTCRHLRY
jgi:hypothetical protein